MFRKNEMWNRKEGNKLVAVYSSFSCVETMFLPLYFAWYEDGVIKYTFLTF